MSGYQKALDMTTIETQAKLASGELKLRAGQWIKCGRDDDPLNHGYSRLISYEVFDSGAIYINAVHRKGVGARAGIELNKSFMARIENRRCAERITATA